MKLSFFSFAFAIAASGAAARDCEGLESMDARGLLMQAAWDAAQCKIASGFDLHEKPGLPTEAKTKAMCAAPACKQYMDRVKELNVPDCALTFRGASPHYKANIRAFADQYDAKCVELNAVTTTPVPTTITPTATTPTVISTPVSTTPTPAVDEDRLCGGLEAMDAWALLARAAWDSAQCKEQSGFDMHKRPGMPTSAQHAKMCTAPACKEYMHRVTELNVPHCRLTIRPHNFYVNIRKVANEFDAKCASTPTPSTATPTSTPTPSSATPSPSAATPTPSSATPASSTTPSSATPSPSAATPTSSSTPSSATPSHSAATPAPSTATPTSTPTPSSTTPTTKPSAPPSNQQQQSSTSINAQVKEEETHGHVHAPNFTVGSTSTNNEKPSQPLQLHQSC